MIYHLRGEKSARDMEKEFFGRTLKMPLSHSSHYEDMYLDNCIAVTETDMTVRRPQKSEHGNAADQGVPEKSADFLGRGGATK